MEPELDGSHRHRVMVRLVQVGVLGLSLGVARKDVREKRGFNFLDYNEEGHGVYMVS
jgi:hypothetical protein